MYLRQSKQKRADGREITYLQLAENKWDAAKGRSQARIVFNCGRADDEAVIERLRLLAKSILRRSSPEAIVADDPDWRLVCAWPYGDVYALREAVWKRLGIDAIVRAQANGRRFGFEMERALFALVANRACTPPSSTVMSSGSRRTCISKARRPWRCISSIGRWTFSKRTRLRSSKRSSSRLPTC